MSIQIQGFSYQNNIATKEITSATGDTYILRITFDKNYSQEELDTKLVEYNKLSSKIANFAKEMKLGEQNFEKNRKLTKLEFGGMTKQGPQFKKVYSALNEDKTFEKTSACQRYFDEKKKLRYKATAELFRTIFPALKKSAPIEKAASPEKVEIQQAAQKRKQIDPSQIVKTDSKHLKQGRINPFMITFNKRCKSEEEKKRDCQRQAKEIFNYCKFFLAESADKRLAITYSANSKQAEHIYQAYAHNKEVSISGDNQAMVFAHLLKLIKAEKLENRIHILPVPTCKESGGAEISSMDDVRKSMNNIAQHIKGGWFVLGLQNQECTPDHPFAIGGGVAKKVWEGQPQQRYVENHMIDMLNGKIPSEKELLALN